MQGWISVYVKKGTMQIVAVKTETASDDPEKTDQSHVLSHYLSGERKLGKSKENSFEKCIWIEGMLYSLPGLYQL